MGRQKFETSAMLEIENNARRFLAKKTGKQIHKLPDAVWGVDWAMYENDQVKHFMEFRRRYNDKDHYPDLRFCAMKYSKLRRYAEDFDLGTSFFVVQFNDALVCVEIGKEDGIAKTLVPFGRTKDQRDDLEVQPSVIIPKSKFKVIENRCVTDSKSSR